MPSTPRLVLRFLHLLALLLPYALPHASAQSPAYDQPYRPQVHFSPARNWTNDPNGLVFYHGEYHLFFQYNPFGDQWGHMSWGHAVSPDLLHWRELPVAIPEEDGTMIFTGSIVVDSTDSSGLCRPAPECLVAVYTGHHQTPSETRQNQNLAFSRDGGRTWTKYAGNPVLDLHMADFRDPSVFWDESRHRWLMAVSLPKQHLVRFFSSPDLKVWTQRSDFGPAGSVAGDWECPDLLRVPPSKPGGQALWALKVGLNPGAPQGGSGEQFFLGSFDGTTFSPSSGPGAHGWTNYGKDDYCAISFNGLPRGQRPVLLGWMSNWDYAAKLPTSPWRGQMSLPRRLSLLSDSTGLALRQQPVTEPLRISPATHVSVTPGKPAKPTALGQPPYELHLTFSPGSEDAFGLKLFSAPDHWTEIGFDRQKALFYIDRTHSGATVAPEFPARTTAPLASGRPFDLQVIVDRSSVEAFAQDGTIAMTDLIFPPSTGNTLEIFSSGGKPVSAQGELWSLHSVWK